MQYDPPQEPKAIQDIKFTWICSGCNAYMKTVEEKKPEKCENCGAGQAFIDKYHIF